MLRVRRKLQWTFSGNYNRLIRHINKRDWQTRAIESAIARLAVARILTPTKHWSRLRFADRDKILFSGIVSSSRSVFSGIFGNARRHATSDASVQRECGVKNLRTTFRESISRLDGCRVESCYRYSAFWNTGLPSWYVSKKCTTFTQDVSRASSNPPKNIILDANLLREIQRMVHRGASRALNNAENSNLLFPVSISFFDDRDDSRLNERALSQVILVCRYRMRKICQSCYKRSSVA